MKENEEWIKAFKEKLEDYSEPMPPSGWERLERELMPATGKRIYPYLQWSVAVAAVVLVVTTAVSLYFLNNPAVDEFRYTMPPSLAVNPDILPAPALPDVRATVTKPVQSVGTMKANSVSGYLAKSTDLLTVSQENRSESQQEPTEQKSTEQGTIERKPTEQKQIESEQIEPVHSSKRKEVRRPSGKDKYQLPIGDSSDKRSGKWSMGVGIGNGGGLSTDGSGLLASRPMSSRVDLLTVMNGTVNIPADQEVIFEEGVPYLKSNAAPVVDYKHHQPVSFGISLRRSLPRGFSVETGLVYTLLSSDIKWQGDVNMQSQKLHYIGIPVRGNWNFLEKNHFMLYVSAGGMVEKCVYGKSGDEKINVKPLQFSVSGAVGAQFNATDHVGIYVESGVSYFFNDGSNVKTIRKERPCNFNLQAGLRFTY